MYKIQKIQQNIVFLKPYKIIENTTICPSAPEKAVVRLLFCYLKAGFKNEVAKFRAG